MSVDGGAGERYEIKFAGYTKDYPDLLHWVKMHSAGFVTAYPDRQVNNVYFDTWDYRAYAENLAGVSERCKVRYRWYGDSPGPAKGSLEVKQKRNHFGTKLRYALPQSPWKSGDTWGVIRKAMRESIPMAGKLWLDQNPLPMMINRYNREYFCTKDGLIRITIDREQRVYDQRLASQPNLTRPAVMQDSLVLEVKFARSQRHDAGAILQNVPLRIGRHSKYMNAVRSIAFV